MMANIYEKKTGKPVGGLHTHLIQEHQGLKIGMFGVAEQEWYDTFPPDLDTEQFEYHDFIEISE